MGFCRRGTCRSSSLSSLVLPCSDIKSIKLGEDYVQNIPPTCHYVRRSRKPARTQFFSFSHYAQGESTIGTEFKISIIGLQLRQSHLAEHLLDGKMIGNIFKPCSHF